MDKLYSIKEEKKEFYAQLEITKNIWKFLDKISNELFSENWMIDDHYRGEFKENDFFSFKKSKIYFSIIMSNKRANIIILGLSDNSKIKNVLFDYYSFYDDFIVI